MSDFKPGDWARWKEGHRPAIVKQVSGDNVEITIWVKAEELNWVPKQ